MLIRAQEIVIDSLDKLEGFVSLGIDEALTAALSNSVDKHLPADWYSGLMAKLAETEQTAFTMALAAEEIVVLPEKVAEEFEIVDPDELGGMSTEMQDDLTFGVFDDAGELVELSEEMFEEEDFEPQALAPLPRVPKGPSQYQKDIKKQVKNPNIRNVKGSHMLVRAKDMLEEE